MKNLPKIHSELNIPLYQQLVDQIRAAVKNGDLVSGERLPTVQEMTEALGIARGTVKKAYDELEKLKILDKAQGRGTFVRYQPPAATGRKEQAMVAIDRMLDELEEMGLSPTEINIFLNLKLRERAEKEAFVRVAVVECNPENLSRMSEQLRHLQGVDLYSYLLEDIKQYPYRLEQGFDLVVTTANHADYLESVLPENRVVRAALRLTTDSLSNMIRIRSGQRVGIVGYSKKFASLLHSACKNYTENLQLSEPLLNLNEREMKDYLKDKDVLLVPNSYEKYFSERETKILASFKGQLLECHYEMDEGSILYLEVKIRRLLEKKTL